MREVSLGSLSVISKSLSSDKEEKDPLQYFADKGFIVKDLREKNGKNS